MNLTEEQRQLAAEGEFVHWTDPDTGKEFVLVPAEHFQKLRSVVDGITRRAGWDDPALDIYEQYRKRS